MEKQFQVETVLQGDQAELYESVLAEFERAGGLSLSQVNRAILQTGMLLHLTMMTSMGVVAEASRREQLDALVEKAGRDNLLWDVIELARRHWRSGGTGAVDFKA
jgi:hypothetical protein